MRRKWRNWKILDSKKENDIIYYLVKWKDFEETEWIKEDEFDTIEIISEYWKEKNRKQQEEQTSPVEKRIRGRPRTHNQLIVNSILFSIKLIILIKIIGWEEINKKFLLCETNGITIDIDDNCLYRNANPSMEFTELVKYMNDETIITVLRKIT